MANPISKTSFLSKYLALFLDNATRLISELDMRDFREDISGSFLSISDNLHSVDTLDTSGATITCALGDITTGAVVVNRILKGSAAINGAKTWAFSNPTSSRKFTVDFEMSSLDAQTLPATAIVNVSAISGTWNSVAKTWTPDIIGKYQMEVTYDDTNHHIKLFGPFE